MRVAKFDTICSRDAYNIVSRHGEYLDNFTTIKNKKEPFRLLKESFRELRNQLSNSFFNKWISFIEWKSLIESYRKIFIIRSTKKNFRKKVLEFYMIDKHDIRTIKFILDNSNLKLREAFTYFRKVIEPEFKRIQEDEDLPQACGMSAPRFVNI